MNEPDDYRGSEDELADALDFMRNFAMLTEPPDWWRELAVREFRTSPNWNAYEAEWAARV